MPLCSKSSSQTHLIYGWGGICCDNEGALHKSSEFWKCIPVGASRADIKRALRTIKGQLKARFAYEWVESHQDRYKLWTISPSLRNGIACVTPACRGSGRQCTSEGSNRPVMFPGMSEYPSA